MVSVLEEARHLAARKRELGLKIEEAAMRGRVEAALRVTRDPQGQAGQTSACLRGQRDLEEFVRAWCARQSAREDCTEVAVWEQLASAMGLPVPTEVLAEVRASRASPPSSRPVDPFCYRSLLSDHDGYVFELTMDSGFLTALLHLRQRSDAV